MILLAALFVALAMLMAALSVPLMQGRVKPNWVYGFRTPSTLKDPALWYEANAYAGRLLFRCALAFLFASVLFALVPGMSVDAYALSVTAVLLVGLVTMLVLSFRFLRKWRADDHGEHGRR